MKGDKTGEEETKERGKEKKRRREGERGQMRKKLILLSKHLMALDLKSDLVGWRDVGLPAASSSCTHGLHRGHSHAQSQHLRLGHMLSFISFF